jgi:hypothetical protein
MVSACNTLRTVDKLQTGFCKCIRLKLRTTLTKKYNNVAKPLVGEVLNSSMLYSHPLFLIHIPNPLWGLVAYRLLAENVVFTIT